MDTIEAVVEQLQKLLAPEPRINRSIGFKSYDGHEYLDTIERVRCVDGFTVSIQASHHHYCTPRDSQGPWTEVELGFPNRRVPSLLEYRDGSPDTKTVFGYVPIEKVAAIIIEHGGLKSSAQPARSEAIDRRIALIRRETVT